MIDWNKYTLDEDGNVCDQRDFHADSYRLCKDCGEDLGDYYEVPTLCDECKAASDREAA